MRAGGSVELFYFKFMLSHSGYYCHFTKQPVITEFSKQANQCNPHNIEGFKKIKIKIKKKVNKK